MNKNFHFIPDDIGCVLFCEKDWGDGGGEENSYLAYLFIYFHVLLAQFFLSVFKHLDKLRVAECKI